MFSLKEEYRLPDYEITKGPEHWNNGYMVTNFEVFDVPFKIMQRIMTDPDDLEYTSLHVDMNIRMSDGLYFEYCPSKYPWLDKYPPRFPGLITVEAAVQIINFAHEHYYSGIERGKIQKQIEVRELLGIK